MVVKYGCLFAVPVNNGLFGVFCVVPLSCAPLFPRSLSLSLSPCVCVSLCRSVALPRMRSLSVAACACVLAFACAGAVNHAYTGAQRGGCVNQCFWRSICPSPLLRLRMHAVDVHVSKHTRPTLLTAHRVRVRAYVIGAVRQRRCARWTGTSRCRCSCSQTTASLRSRSPITRPRSQSIYDSHTTQHGSSTASSLMTLCPGLATTYSSLIRAITMDYTYAWQPCC